MKKLDILFENSEILLINKPAGLAVQGGVDIKYSVDSLLAEQLNTKVYLVHRLDKETAGILMIAKTSLAATKWTNLIGSKQVAKYYQALCFGTLPNNKGVFSEPLLDKGQSKNAITKYSILNNYNNKASLIECKLETGRMHQIRKHLAMHNCPIIGDDKYGNFTKNKEIKKIAKVKKMLLVANRLIFSENGENSDKQITISIALPDYFTSAITFFKQNQE